ncbi:MAG: hypothetical protein K2X06_08520 [Burkholderiales bacterium]|nr:hypothetical protein [Burkholderiales bacterium]
MPARHLLIALGWIAACGLDAGANAAPATPFIIESRQTISDLAPQADTASELTLRLSVANIDRWDESEVIAALRIAANLLAQCRIRVSRAELLQITVPDSHRHFDTPRSRELADALALPKPTLYFTAGTRQTPAFDAEAIGRGNSRSRPELTDTVWIARGARDLGLVIAHELVHVLMDSGAHDHTPGNLMAEDTAPQNTRLSAAQCARMRDTGTRNGLLRPGVD